MKIEKHEVQKANEIPYLGQDLNYIYMRTNLLKLFMLALFTLSIGPLANAQNELGFKAAYSNELQTFGAGVRGVLHINESFSFSPEITGFLPVENNVLLPDNETAKLETRLVLFNADLHYNLDLYIPDFNIYVLAGFNYTDVDKRLSGTEVFEDASANEALPLRESGIGANLGFGVDYTIRTGLKVFVEPKYVFNDFSQFIFSLGITASL